ncbi:MAG TPA: hypothetical protein VJ617_06635 [Arthrobacter sp.]|nr:hypothetical protein [Arthrobacter sp.]
MPENVIRLLRVMELAGSVVPQRQQARPAAGEVDVPAAARAGKVFPDMDVA